MKITATSALCAALLAIAGTASGSAINSINYGYSVSGDDQARPVQAFDDGQALFIQLRNPASPPSPIGEAGPIAYKLRGYYMVVPIQSRIRLQYQNYRADVVANGYSNDDVVSLTAPIDAYSVSTPLQRKSHAETFEPVAPYRQQPISVVASAVSGDISVGFGAAASTPAAISDDAVSANGLADESGSRLSYSEARMRSTYDSLQGRSISLTADGTVSGAEAARSAKSVCEMAGVTCIVKYNGGAPGVLLMKTEG